MLTCPPFSGWFKFRMHSALVGGPNQQQHQVSACSPTNHQEGWQALLGLERKMTFSEYFLHVRPWVYITLLEAPNLCASTAGHQALLAIIWHPLQYSCLENPMDGGAWWAACSPWGR